MFGSQNLTGSLFTNKLSLPKIITNFVNSAPRESPSPSLSSTLVSSKSSLDYTLSSPFATSTNTRDFYKSLVAAYSAASPTSSGYAWCPVFKQYLPPCIIDVVHIIPTHTNHEAVGYLFGNSSEGAEHIKSLSNGIIMASCIARLFVQGDFGIVPVETNDSEESGNNLQNCFERGTTIELGNPTWNELHPEEQNSLLEIQELKESLKSFEGHQSDKTPICPRGFDTSLSSCNNPNPNPGIKLKLILMKPHLSSKRMEDMDLYYSDLHNIILEFKSSFRPDLRYLYFRYITSLLIWLNIDEAKLYKNAWRPKERWLRESLIVEIARPERMSNWDVYEEVVAGVGTFENEEGESEEEWVIHTDTELEKNNLQRMVQQLLVGLLGFTSIPHYVI
ncbi:hypothetical protein ABW20_dc0107702 [Dactylellina cionopaga]|nr:hypothetical protein ABW20_dc0107702 [Dactylellina cionopaga]